MAVTLEVVHSRIRPGSEEKMLALRPAMIAAVRARCPGMLEAQLVRLDDGTQLDIIQWSSRQAAEDAARQFSSIPEAAAMAELVEEVLSFWHGTAAEPLR